MRHTAASVSDWRSRYGPNFLTTALVDRAVRWSWKRCEHGWSFEIAFRTDGIRDEFTGQPAIKAALDAACAMGATVDQASSLSTGCQ